ncbi:MAG: spore coat associated protein CotJA [Clostridia bacterium]
MVPMEMMPDEELAVGLDCEPVQQKQVLAMAYVPYQEFEDLYSNEDALKYGTLFKQLNLPFTGKRVGNIYE